MPAMSPDNTVEPFQQANYFEEVLQGRGLYCYVAGWGEIPSNILKYRFSLIKMTDR